MNQAPKQQQDNEEFIVIIERKLRYYERSRIEKYNSFLFGIIKECHMIHSNKTLINFQKKWFEDKKNLNNRFKLLKEFDERIAIMYYKRYVEEEHSINEKTEDFLSKFLSTIKDGNVNDKMKKYFEFKNKNEQEYTTISMRLYVLLCWLKIARDKKKKMIPL